MKRCTRHFAPMLAACSLLAAPALADEALGHVSSVKGDVTAQRGSEAPRRLACGDPVYAGDTLRTAASSRVGILAGDLMTQLAPDSQLRLDRTGRGMPAAALERGKVRVIDPRDGGTPAQLAALDVAAEVRGNDAEAYVFVEKVGPYAMLCDWSENLPVARGADERVVAAPGQCVIAKPTEPLYTAQAHETRIPIAAAEECGVAPDLLASLAGSPLDHLSPADVAAPGPVAGVGSAGLGSSNPQGAQMPARAACDNPGAGCIVRVPLRAVSQPVGPGPPLNGSQPVSPGPPLD